MKTRYLIILGLIIGLVGLGIVGAEDEKKDEKPPETKLPPEITPEIQKAIEKGIDWLLTAQNNDGSWGHDIKSPPEVGITSVVGMSFMSLGTTPRGGKPNKVLEPLKKGLSYVIKFGKERRAMFDEESVLEREVGRKIHFYLTSLFLSQVQGETVLQEVEYEDLKNMVKKINHRIDQEQDKDGFWHDQNLFLSSATAWLALRSAYASGLTIRHASVEKTIDYLKKAYNPKTKTFGNEQHRNSVVLASSLRILYGYGLGNSDEAIGGTERMLKDGFNDGGRQNPLGAEHYLAAVYATQSFRHKEKEKLWLEWYQYISKYLLKLQNQDGSWTGSRCITARTFCTACAILTLTTPYRLLPMLEF